MKKLFIPFNNYKGVGGPFTFMGHLRRFLDRKDFQYTERHEEIKAVFFPIQYDLNHLKMFKEKSIKIIQRLDGIYYPSKHGEEYINLNKNIKEIHTNLADIVIYQSNYSKKQCEAMFGKPLGTETHIILNGTDKEVFCPSDKEVRPFGDKEIRLITTGNFRNTDMIEPVIKALNLLKPDVKFRLIAVGNISNEKIRHFFEVPFIEWKPYMEQAGIAAELRSSDIFLYSHLNPPCPNSVIEAVSCGLPVVGFRSGAMDELLHFNKELLADVSDEVFQEYKDFDEHKLAEKILLAVKDFPLFKQRALEHSHLYAFEETGEKYLAVFKEALESKTNSGWRRILGLG